MRGSEGPYMGSWTLQLLRPPTWVNLMCSKGVPKHRIRRIPAVCNLATEGFGRSEGYSKCWWFREQNHSHITITGLLHVWVSNIPKGVDSDWMDIPTWRLFEREAIPNRWTFRVDGYSKWMTIPSGWLFWMAGYLSEINGYGDNDDDTNVFLGLTNQQVRYFRSNAVLPSPKIQFIRRIDVRTTWKVVY